MSKIKTVYDELLPDVKKQLQASAREYNSAKRLKYVLMTKYVWSHLTIDEMRDLLTYTKLKSWQLEPESFMYGDKILIQK
ncbi:hypothetical protein DRO61_05850 [Candidatus Bathyarchaeota archaeon]|nr:MAG: hypothetical protein DRO61_05850 [Candidatus Bathyarchaeota archaeon]